MAKHRKPQGDEEEMSPKEYAQYLADREAVRQVPPEVLKDAIDSIKGLPSKSGDLND
jgi:hypothetical protein